MEQVIPAGAPPADVISNFVDPVNYSLNLVTCNVVLLVVSSLVVVARIISRTVLTDWRLGWDDYAIGLALIGTVIFSVFVIETTHYGLGTHIWDVPLATYKSNYLWWNMASFAACPASYYFVKLSILFFYLRVLNLQAKLRYIIYALFTYCTIYYWVAFFSVIGLCNVKDKTWDITVSMNCFAYGKFVSAIGGLDLVADVLILAFPVPLVIKLQITWTQRFYLLSVFLCGISASVVCAVRIAFVIQARGSTDATMAQYHIVVLFCIEHYLALIAACMPTLGPFFNWLRPSHWKHSNCNALGLEDRTYDDAEAFQDSWPRLHTIPSLDEISKHGSIEDPDKTALNDVDLPYWLASQLGREQSVRISANVTRLYNFEEREESPNLAGEQVGEDVLVLQRN